MNRELIEATDARVQQAGLRIRIQHDSEPQSPDEWGNDDLFLIAEHREFCVRRRGFACDQDTPKNNQADYHVLPLIAYIHSGVALSLGRDRYPFNCQWDAGQVGWVLVQKRKGFRNIEQAAQSLVREWNQYLSGDVWGYVIETKEGKQLDSCWGIYGREYCEKSAQDAAVCAAVEHEAGA